MRKVLFMFLTMGLMASCSSDDGNGSSDDVTSAKIMLKKPNNEPVTGLVVHAYSEATWEVIGENPVFADFQAASGSDGVATFANLTSDTDFNEINNYTHTFRFVARYTLNGAEKTKVKAITFNLGDDKTDTLILD